MKIRLSNRTDEELQAGADYYRLLAKDKDDDSGLWNRDAAIREELLDRRAEAASELRQMERKMAFESACAVIEGCCGAVIGRPDWFDLDLYAPEAIAGVAEAVAYLRMRDLIENDDDSGDNIVSIRFESEANDAGL